MTQQMQNLQLSQTRKCPGGPASPNAAKRLYRNLSEKLRGSTSSFEDAYFFGKTDRLRKASVSLQERKRRGGLFVTFALSHRLITARFHHHKFQMSLTTQTFRSHKLNLKRIQRITSERH